MNDFDAQVRREKASKTMHAIWLYDEDDECRKLVDASPEYSVYSNSALRKNDATLHSYGEDYARAVVPGFTGEPMSLVENVIAKLPEERRSAYQTEYDRLSLSRKDTKNDYYALFAKIIRDEVRGKYAEQQKKQELLKQELDDVQSSLEDALPKYALGEELSPELMDRVAKFGTPDELFPSLKRARAAVELVRGWNYGERSKADYEAAVQARFERLKEEDLQPVTSGGNLVSSTKLQRMHTDEELMQQARADEGDSYMVSREQIAALADVLSDKDGQLDKGALGAFLLGIDADAQGQQTINSKFIRNAVEAMKGGFLEAADFLNRGNAAAGAIWQGPDMPMVYLDEEGRKGFDRAYSDKVEELRGHLAQMEGRRLDASEKAKFHSWLLTKGGTIVGENVPYMVTGALGSAARLGVVGNAVLGGLANAPAIMNRSIGQAYAEGKKNAKFVGSVQGLAQSWAEAAFVPLPGGSALVNKTLDALARKAISLPGAGKMIGAVWGNGLMRYVATTAGASAGELLGEEVLAQTVQYPVLDFARRAGIDLDKPEWQPFADSWKAFNDDPRQAAATVVYCALMGASGARGNAYAAREFAKEYRNLMAAGLKPGSARRLSLQAEQASSAKDMETLLSDMREAYRREVREGDQVALKKRLEKEGESFLDEVEMQMYARSGVRDYVLQRAGILAADKTAAGLNRVTLPNKENPDKPTVVEWTDEQLNAWVEMQHESKIVEAMRDLQARIAGAALGEAELTDADVKGMLVNLRDLPIRALARMQRTGGRVTYAVLKDLAADAREQVAGFVESGMSRGEAYQQMSEIPGVRLGTLVKAAEGFTQRVEAIVGTPEGDALGIRTVDDASTAVFRLDSVAPGQSVLLFNKGLVTEREMVEDLIERDVVAATAGENAVTSLKALGDMLRRVQSHLMRYEGGMRLLPTDKEPTEMDIVEAFSKLAQSRFLLNHQQYNMPQEAHDTIEYVQKKMASTQHLVALSRAWDAFARSEEGRAFIEKEGATLEKLMSDAGASVAGQYSRARFTAEAFEAVKLAYEQSVASPEAAQAVLNEYEAEQHELDHPKEQQTSIPASASITGEKLPLFDSAPVDQETGEQQLQLGEVEQTGGNLGRNLVGERYVEVGDGSVLGVAEVESISLSTDVPQFKKKESAVGRVEADEDGTTHELAGGWNANAAPIHVWRRTDGRLEVISGRHRLAHARKNGVKFIQVRVYDESAERDAQWAKLHDVEQNILDNTCNAIDVAYYFRHNPLTMAEAEARGLLPKTRAGEQTAASRIGLTVAANASDNTFTLLVNGKCTAEDAYMACLIASTEDGQQLALESRAGKNGKKNSWEYVTALVRGAEQMQPADGGMLDLFGNDDAFRESSEKLARYVAAVRDGLKARLNVLMSAGRLNKKGDVSKELGVKVKTPKDATRLIERLANLDAAYERLDPDLGIPAKADAWDGKSAVPTKLDELAGGSSFALSAEMADIKAAAEKDGTFMKAPNGQPSNLNEKQWLQVRTAAFRKWFGDWESLAYINSFKTRLLRLFSPEILNKVKGKDYNSIKSMGFDTRVLPMAYIPHSIAKMLGAGIADNLIYSSDFRLIEHLVNHHGEVTDYSGYVSQLLESFADPDRVYESKDRKKHRLLFVKGNKAIFVSIVSPPEQGTGSRRLMWNTSYRKDNFNEDKYNLIWKKVEDVDAASHDKGPTLNESPAAPLSALPSTGNIKETVRDVKPENVSKIVDENGEPKVVTHATNAEPFTVFRRGERPGLSGKGIYFSPDGVGIWGKNIMRCFLNVRNPLTKENAPREVNNGGMSAVIPDVFERFPQYDGVMLRRDEITVRDPEQVKSATDNRGTFDGSNPDITFSLSDRNLAAVSPEMDARYMEAVKRGDMAAAQRMVNDVARMRGYMPDSDYQGSECFNGAAPSSNAYFDTDDERYEAWENGDFEGTVSLADFVRRGMDPGELEWLVTSPGAYQRADQYKRESIEAIRKAKASKRGKVTIYRAVPADIKEGSVRNGDWVTFSKAYAEYHISLQDWEKGRIIKQVVSLDDVWWDGNDVNEWGYDDGKEYAYSNTTNNRKLLDAVTYDKNGDVVPLSKRFDYSSPDVSFSVVGPSAANWDKIKHRAFKGRDDGKLRVELDASGAEVSDKAFESRVFQAFESLVQAGYDETLAEDDAKILAEYAAALREYKALELEWLNGGAEDTAMWNKLRDFRKTRKELQAAAYDVLERWSVKHGGKGASLFHIAPDVMDRMVEDFMAGRVSDETWKALNGPRRKGVVYLGDVLDFPELYEAYPDLKSLTVWVEDLGLLTRGRLTVDGFGGFSITLNEMLLDDVLQMRSTLLHEVQHWIQYKENFAKGGNETMAERLVSTGMEETQQQIQQVKDELDWLNGIDFAKEQLQRIRRILLRPRAILKMSERWAVHEVQNVDVMAAEAVDMMWDEYALMQRMDAALARRFASGPGKMLPVRNAEKASLHAVEQLLGEIDKMKSRKVANKGRKGELLRRMDDIYGTYQQFAKLDGLNGYALYQRLAGEIESRNVQLRRDWTAAERDARPFNETLEYPGEALVSFSLSGRSMIDSVDLGTMAHEEQMQRLMNHARREAARWERTFANGTTNVKAAEAMGTISSIQNAIYKVLPQGYRPELARQMRYVEVYARMLETGRVRAYGKLKPEELEALNEELGELLEADLALVSGGIWYDEGGSKAEAEEKARQMLTREMGAEKLGQAAARLLNAAADSVERWMIDVELERVERMKERLAPRKLPNGKYDKGKMSADAYKEFMRYCELMEMDADAVGTKMQELEALIAAEEQKPEPDADKMVKLASSLAELAAYGNLKGKNLEAVRKGVAALAAFVKNERNVWQGKLELERERTKRAARNMAEQMGHGDEVKLAEKAEMAEGSFQMFNDMSAGFRSLAQMFYGMGGIPGMRELMDESLDALTRGNIQLGLREQRAYDQLGEFMEKKLKLDSETKRNDWMAGLKKKIDTGVQRAGELVTHKLELTQEEAEEWLALSKEERDEKRQAMQAKAEKDGVDARNVVYEEDIPLLRDELAKFDDLPGKRKFIRTERSWRKAQAGNIVASRDEILNILLLCEQTEYQQAADENGYTPAVLEQLRAVVGEDVMAYGHEMRRILEGSGLAAVYEAREGIPFPAVKNYWPGNFDLSAKMNEQANALDPTTGTGTRYGMLITRVKHKLKFNLSLGASNVFLAAMAQQNNYICIGELTAKWRRLLSHANFAMSLKQRLGDKQFRQLKELLNLLDGAGIAESVTQQNLSGLMSRFQSAHAMAVLAGSPVTLIKQTSAMLHAGAWEGINPLRVVWHLLKDRAGNGAITYGEIKEMDAFKVRHRDNRYFTEFMQLGRNANWSKMSTWARTGMGWIEKMDIACNAASMTALYNIKYEQLQDANVDAADPLSEAEMRSICERAVEQALELSAQPLRRTQKSAMAALSRNALVKSACYMSSESLNKIGMYTAIKQRNGGGVKGRLAALKFLLPLSIAQQATVMVLDMMRGSAPDSADDDWAEWFWLNVATGCTGLGMLQSVPMLGEGVAWATGGYVKTASLGEMLFDFRGAARSAKRLYKMSTDSKDYSGWEWAWQMTNAGRIITAGTGIGRGVNSTSKVFSEVSGGLQSLNAVVNHVRPVIQGVRNREKK